MAGTKVLNGYRHLKTWTFLNSGGIRTSSIHSAGSGKISTSRVLVNISKPNHHATIAVINLNDYESRNSLSKDNVFALLKTLECLRANDAECDPIRALILRCTIPNVFCAGANLKERLAMTRIQVESWLKIQRSLMDSIGGFPYPTIAAIDGHALGGGLELALACDMRIINETAKVGLVETRLAIIPGAGGTQRLARLIGIGRAKEHIFVAEPIDGNEAFKLGIANHAVSGQGGAYQKAIEIAEKICRRGPMALRLAKAAIDDGLQTSLNTGLNIENAYYCQSLDSRDRMEGMKAFTEKREPVYIGA